MKISTALFTVSFAFAIAAHAIDFTPYYADSLDDGVPMRRMYFSDGARRIFYRPPHTWALSGSSESATFRPKNSEKATITIRNGPAEHARISLPPDATGLESLRKIARTLVPAGALEVVQIREAINPVVLHGWTSFEAVFDYQQAGQPFSCSVLLINLDAERQVRFIVDAPAAEFPPLYKTTLRTLATWWQTTEKGT